MKKLMAFFMAVCLLLSAAACGSPATGNPEAGTLPAESDASHEASVFAGGSGTEAEPYQVASVAQLEAFRDGVNSGEQGGYAGVCFQLTADLDLSGTDWTPIGTMEDMEGHSTMFLGTFDGGGHTISGLTYSIPASKRPPPAQQLSKRISGKRTVNFSRSWYMQGEQALLLVYRNGHDESLRAVLRAFYSQDRF